ncbi:MAG: hypothetical protein QXP02_00105 [Desulfurococcaceae archaeon]
MVSKKDLVVIDKYAFFNELRFKICVKGTNIVLNIGASSEEEAMDKALTILSNIGLDDESLEHLRKLIEKRARC